MPTCRDDDSTNKTMTREDYQRILTYVPNWLDPYGVGLSPGKDFPPGSPDYFHKLMAELREWDPELVSMLEERYLLEKKIYEYVKSKT